MNIDFEELHVFDNNKSKYVPREMYEKAQADANRRGELLMRCKEMLRHLALTYPGQVFEKDIGILLLITEIQQGLE